MTLDYSRYNLKQTENKVLGNPETLFLWWQGVSEVFNYQGIINLMCELFEKE